MPSQGPNNPGALADDATEGAVAWSNPTNAATSNDVRATAGLTVGQSTHWLKAQNFGFSLPSNVTITGLMVEVERVASVTPGILDSKLQLLDDTGTPVGSNKFHGGVSWPTSDAYDVYGAEGDLWTVALTPAMINDPDFGVIMAVQNSIAGSVTAGIDHIRMTAFYSTTNSPQRQAGNKKFNAGGLRQVDFLS